MSAARPRPRRGSIATDGWQARRSFWLPFRLLLLLDPCNRLLQLTNVVARQFPGFCELRHHRLRSPAEQAQNLVEQPVTRHVTRDERFEDMGVADLPDATHGTFRFKPIDRRLNRGIGRSRRGESLLDFTYRGFPERPERLENLQLQSGKLRLFSHLLPIILIYYQIVDSVKGSLE